MLTLGGVCVLIGFFTALPFCLVIYAALLVKRSTVGA